MATPHTAAPHVTVSQTNKEATINNQADALDNAIHDAADFAVGSDNVIQFGTVSFRRYFLFRFRPNTGATANWDYTVPAGVKKHFAVDNQSGFDAFISVGNTASDEVRIQHGEFGIFYSDGVTVVRLTGGFQGTNIEVSDENGIIRQNALGITFSGAGITVSEVSDGRVEVNIGPNDGLDLTTQTANFSVTNAMLLSGNYIQANNAAALAITVPSGLTGLVPLVVEATGAGTVSFVAGAGVTINSLNAALEISGRYGVATLYPKGSNVYTLFGALA